MIYATILAVCFAVHDIPDGSLLFVEGGNKTVMDHTESPYSHVAVIFNIDGEPWVYEAVKPVVRKIKLSDYIKEIESENKKKDKLMKLWIRKPRVYIDTKKMREYSEKMLGTEYSVKSYITGNPQKGKIHCGELTARSLLAGELKVHGNPCKKTPQGIMNLCRPYYHKAMML
jgi:hypothetical protein